MANQICKPKTIVLFDDPEKQQVRYPWRKCALIAEFKNVQKENESIPIVEEYSKSLGNKQDADDLRDDYLHWSATNEVQITSQITHEIKVMKQYIGRGQTPKFRYLPVAPKQLPDHMHSDSTMRYLQTVETCLTVRHRIYDSIDPRAYKQ